MVPVALSKRLARLDAVMGDADLRESCPACGIMQHIQHRLPRVLYHQELVHVRKGGISVEAPQEQGCHRELQWLVCHRPLEGKAVLSVAPYVTLAPRVTLPEEQQQLSGLDQVGCLHLLCHLSDQQRRWAQCC